MIYRLRFIPHNKPSIFQFHQCPVDLISFSLIQLTELEANNRHQEVETTNNVREYERALSGVQQEVTAYQTVLAQTQVIFKNTGNEFQLK